MKVWWRQRSWSGHAECPREKHRRLFDRVIANRFSSRKMKFFFKRYLEFERLHGGDAARVEYVKKRALEYVQSLNNNEE